MNGGKRQEDTPFQCLVGRRDIGSRETSFQWETPARGAHEVGNVHVDGYLVALSELPCPSCGACQEELDGIAGEPPSDDPVHVSDDVYDQDTIVFSRRDEGAARRVRDVEPVDPHVAREDDVEKVVKADEAVVGARADARDEPAMGFGVSMRWLSACLREFR